MPPQPRTPAPTRARTAARRRPTTAEAAVAPRAAMRRRGRSRRSSCWFAGAADPLHRPPAR